MAAKTLGFKLTIDGVEYSLEQLKKLATQAEKVDTATSNVGKGGTGGIDKIGQSAEQASAKTEKLVTSTEKVGLTTEQQLQNFGKFARGVTGAFSAAATAAQFFGGSSADATKVAEQAQKAFNVVLGVSAALEAGLALKKLLTVGATKQQTIASTQAIVAVEGQAAATTALAATEAVATTTTLTLTGAIKALGAAIKSNPIGIILTLASAAVIIYDQLKDTTDELADANERLDNATRKLIQAQDEQLNTSKRLLEVEIANAEATNATLEDLLALRIKGLDKEKEIANNKIEILENAAKAEERIEELRYNQGTINKEEFEKRKLAIEQKYAPQIFTLTQSIEDTKTKIQVDSIKTREQIEERNRKFAFESAQFRISLLTNSYKKELENLNETLKQENIAVSKSTLTQAQKFQRLAEIGLTYQKDYQELIKKFNEENEKLTEDAARDVENINKAAREEEISELKQSYADKIKLFVENTQKLNEVQYVNPIDLDDEAVKSSFEGLLLRLKDLEPELSKTFKTLNIDLKNNIDKFSAEQIKVLDFFIQKYGKAYQKIQEVIKSEGAKAITNINELSQNVADNEALTLEDRIEKAQDSYNIDFENYKKAELDKIRLFLESSGIIKDDLEKQILIYQKRLDKIKESGAIEIAISKRIAQIVKEDNIGKSEGDEEYYNKITELTKKYAITSDMSLSQIAKSTEKYNKEKEALDNEYFIKTNQNNRTRLQNENTELSKNLETNKEQIAKNNAEIAKLDSELNQKQRDNAKKTLEEQQAARIAKINELKTIIAEFETLINNFASVTAQGFSLRLQGLEIDLNKQLEQISQDAQRIDGESQESFLKRQELVNQKRIEAEKIYQAQKKQIEKEAQIASLKIQIAQATASAAQSVLSVLAAPPPIGGNPILQGILIAANAAIALAQIGQITQQISMVQSMARGGFLRGPSHEQGGIKYQGGGVEVEGNESVINRRSTLAYAPLLSQINMQGGGRPIYVNSVMDSRMAEVLASTKQEPIRAYVLEKDITKSQAVNRRLDQLASY
jgi:hypothetical protein